MPRVSFSVLAAACIGPFLCAQSTAPPAPKRPVTDIYNGIKVFDEYRWLENWSDPETRAWSDAENTYARKYLDALPRRTALHKQIEDLASKPSDDFWALRLRGAVLFAIRDQPPKQQPC